MIDLMALKSEEPFFRRVNVKRFPFTYYSNIKEANRELKNILRELSDKGIAYATPHEGYMYFLGDDTEIIRAVKDFEYIKDYSEEVEEFILEPTVNSTHYHIVRMLFYIALKSTYRHNLMRVPILGGKEVILIPKQSSLILSLKSVGSGIAKPSIKCYIGLRVKLEIKQSGYGILWYDTVATAVKDNKRLSSHELRNLGLLGDFRKLSIPSPRDRHKRTSEYFLKIFNSPSRVEVDFKDVGKVNFVKFSV
jgi:hypothetical protein